MGRVADASQRERALADRATILRPAPAHALTRLALSGEEGFLLSRIDRPVTVGDVLRLASFPEARALQVLLNLVEKGAVLLPGDAEPKRAAGDTTTSKAGPGPWGEFIFSPSELNEDVELEKDIRKLVLFLFHQLDAISYFRLLGVSPLATSVELRNAYLERSKQFHPDSFFRKRLGTYLPKIAAIFQRLKLAYDTLSDDEPRRKYERDQRRLFSSDEQSALVEREIALLEEEKRQRGRRERLMKAKGFARLTRARELMVEGDEALGKGDISAASASYQLAAELDPRLDEARAKLIETRRVAISRRADLALEQAARFDSEGIPERAVDLLRGAAEMDPNNARVHFALAGLLLRAGDPKDARNHAQRVVDLGERSGRARLLLGETMLKSGLKKNARRELEAAAAAGEADRAAPLLKQC